MNEMANKDTLSSEDQGILLRQDWTELGFNDPVTKMEKVMRVDCWYELNADCPDGIFFLPELSLNNLCGVDFEKLQSLLGGGGTNGWGRQCLSDSFFIRGVGNGLARSVPNGEEPLWILYSPTGRVPTFGPGELLSTQSSCRNRLP